MHKQKKKNLKALSERDILSRSDLRLRFSNEEIPHTYKSRVKLASSFVSVEPHRLQEVRTNG